MAKEVGKKGGVPPTLLNLFFSAAQEEGTTMFLLAAYARYSRPYVWVRSNHERIILVSDSATQDQSEKDYPLNLISTAKWTEEGDIRCDHSVQSLVFVQLLIGLRHCLKSYIIVIGVTYCQICEIGWCVNS